VARVVAAPTLGPLRFDPRDPGESCEAMWIIGVGIIVVMVGCVAAIFLGGGEQGPFLTISKFGGRRTQRDFQRDLRKPPNENELL
jgi:hypothetical protein